MNPSDSIGQATAENWPGDPTPLKARGTLLVRWIAPAISFAILIAVLFALRNIKWADIRDAVPESPVFWIVFAIYYFTPVALDWAIFRYLWGIPASGFIALLRKLVSNDLLFGYIGEAYFYSWARKKLDMVASPFGAVKDTAILSALAGNVATLVMMAFAYPLVQQLQFHIISERLRVSETMLWVSVFMVVGIPTLAILFGNRLFSLTRQQLFVVGTLQMTRVVATTGLAALAWSLALPQVGFSEWIILATIRLIISRLPFVSQKDIVFAGIAILTVGRDFEIAALITFWAAIQFMTHVFFGGVLGVGYFVNMRGKK
ncbi:hypothetical protein [Sphingomonas sp.]|uniref:hypothetical protein n=1 Tax=Sphingomonas sp. TaxID=28214 RepID=UPI0025F99099|nr:hypothetical protein [Sphingomonas sp.]